MGEFVTLKAADGFELGGYLARPNGEPVAGLVVVQEIFGVNEHIRSVADGYAKDGFLVAAPAIFDRVERGVELGYEGDDRQRAMSFIPRLDTEKSLADIAAAVAFVRNETGKKVGVIGYCLGGTLAWVSAARLPIDAAIGYYGGHIGHYLQEKPAVPVMLNFGKLDTHIPAEGVEKIHAAHPEVEIYWYDAGHGFNRDGGMPATPEARERSLNFLKKHLA